LRGTRFLRESLAVASHAEPPTGRSPWQEAIADLRQAATAFVATFRSRELGRTQLAFAAFNLLEWGGGIALFVFAFQIGGVAAVGLSALALQIPAGIIAPFASVLVDRIDRRRLLIAVMASLTLLTAGAGAAMLLGAPTWLAFALAASSGWALTLVRPTYSALLPWLARSPQELTTSYAAMGLIESISIFIGPLLAGVVFAYAGSRSLSGPGLAYIVFSILTLAGVVSVWSTRESNESAEEADKAPFRAPDLWAGFSYVVGDDRRRLLVSLAGSSMFMLGILDTIIVVLALDVLHAGDAGVGFLNAAMGAGSIVGATVAMVAVQRQRLHPMMQAGLLTTGLPLAVVAATPLLSAPMFAISGAGMQLMDTSALTMLQRVVPDDKLGRVFGVLESLYVGLEGLGALASALLIVWIGPAWTLAVASVLLPVAGFLLRRRIASLDVGVRIPTEEIARLRATDLFAPLPPPALERVARDLVPLDLPAGSIVIREGDPGSRFYVLTQGRAVVSRGGEVVTERGPGDYFGEVALLLEQPRNATVTALSDIRVFVLEREEFLRVVTGHSGVGLKARSVAAERTVPDPPDP
jgi:MFS family permease